MRSPITGKEIDLYIYKPSSVQPEFVASFATLAQLNDYRMKHCPNDNWAAVGKQIIAGTR